MSELLGRLWRFLTDTSAADANRYEVAELLGAALAASTSDADFGPALRRVLRKRFPENGADFHRAVALELFLRRHTRAADRWAGAGIRTRATHVLDDLPRIYGVRGSERGVG